MTTGNQKICYDSQLDNLRTGMFFPESNIWNEDTLRENVHDYDTSPHRDVEVQMVQSVIEKQEFMDVNAEIGLSFMGMTITSAS